MSRREIREQVFKLLFRIEFNKQSEMPEQLELFFGNQEEDVEEVSLDMSGENSEESSEESSKELEKLALAQKEQEEKDKAEITDKYERIISKKAEIDKSIEEKAVGWNLKRMGKVDLTLLRLAVFEIMFDDEIPTSVAINEAVELAKKFGQDESPSFVNGVLAKFAK